MSEQFTVAIVGGGLAGLAVAVHLEKLGIKWFLLEGCEEIAPEVGASIGLSPNGMEVLDQLGVYDEVASKAVSANNVTIMNGEGKKLSECDLLPRIAANHGFDVRFTERRIVMKVLYDKIQAKENIHTGQPVNKIEYIGEKVQITTREGSSHTADIVIGTDGIHSLVRGEMWRNAAEDGSNVFGKDPGADVSTEYGCTFGISGPSSSLKEGSIRQIHSADSAIGYIIGLENTVYWFHFFKLPKKHMGIDLPRFTKEQEKEYIDRDANLILEPGLTLGDVYKNKRVSVITPLPNHRFPRWHYRRVICIGDAVCKSQPIAGQGGCSALESGLAVVDNIYKAMKANDMKPLSDAQVEAVFTTTTKIREKRTVAAAKDGLLYMKLVLWSNTLYRLIDTYLIKLIPNNTLVDYMFLAAAGGYHSNTLPAPVEKYVRGSGEPITATKSVA